jgi:hypothetical protein
MSNSIRDADYSDRNRAEQEACLNPEAVCRLHPKVHRAASYKEHLAMG